MFSTGICGSFHLCMYDEWQFSPYRVRVFTHWVRVFNNVVSESSDSRVRVSLWLVKVVSLGESSHSFGWRFPLVYVGDITSVLQYARPVGLLTVMGETYLGWAYQLGMKVKFFYCEGWGFCHVEHLYHVMPYMKISLEIAVGKLSLIQ